mmetsp:Transcript_8384/g.23853  ORF Transcript_8384/g.23853 Transcript_8384/m.23853 type:complete len:310 (+) Transcript_8384:124-1053(+)
MTLCRFGVCVVGLVWWACALHECPVTVRASSVSFIPAVLPIRSSSHRLIRSAIMRLEALTPDEQTPQLHINASMSRPGVTRREVVRANRQKPLPKVVVPPELREYIHDAAHYSTRAAGINRMYGKLRYRQWTITHEGYFFWPSMHELVRQTEWRVVVWCADGPDDKRDVDIEYGTADEYNLFLIEKDGLNVSLDIDSDRNFKFDGTLFAVVKGIVGCKKAWADLRWLMRVHDIKQCASVVGNRWYFYYYDREADEFVKTMDDIMMILLTALTGAAKGIGAQRDRLEHPHKEKQEPDGPGMASNYDVTSR